MNEGLDIVEAEAKAELRKERMTAAKQRLKAKLIAIAATETILANHRREYDDLLASIREGN